MAGPNNQYKFSKEMLNTHSKNAYQDPTYLSFMIMFDTTSPLLNPEVAVKTLREFYKETTKADKLQQFIDTLILLNKEMPWYWKSITGVERAVGVHANRKDGYLGGDEAKLEIACNETINLAISGLMDLYREAMFDNEAWTQILPENYRKFRMWVIVSEVRKFSNSNPDSLNIIDWDDPENSATENTPMFKFEFNYCEFRPESAGEAFATLSPSAPTMADDIKLTINYETVKRIDNETNYLQGIVKDATNSVNGTDPNVQPLGDRVSKDLSNIAQENLARLNRSIAKANPANLLNNPGNVYGSAAERLYQSGLRGVDNFATGVSRTPQNIYKDAIVNVESGANAFKQAIATNVFGAAGKPVNEALKRGAIASIFPLINNQRTSPRGNLGNVNE